MPYRRSPSQPMRHARLNPASRKDIGIEMKPQNCWSNLHCRINGTNAAGRFFVTHHTESQRCTHDCVSNRRINKSIALFLLFAASKLKKSGWGQKRAQSVPELVDDVHLGLLPVACCLLPVAYCLLMALASRIACPWPMLHARHSLSEH